MNRRNFIKTAALTSCASFFAPPLMAKTQDKNAILGFKAIDINTKDTFVVPEGYEAKPFIVNYGSHINTNMQIRKLDGGIIGS